MGKSKETGIYQETQRRKRGRPRIVRSVHRSLDKPPKDKMMRKPPVARIKRKKEIWELLAEREDNIHGSADL